MQQGGDSGQPAGIAAQSIAVPQSGGALTGIGELFEADEFTGAAGLTLPLPSSSVRDFEPELTLSYSSGTGNGPFGLGFSLSLPAVTRSAGSGGYPRYQDDDSFTLSGQGKLVPLDDGRRTVDLSGTTYTVTSYAPQLETSFDVIEYWVEAAGGESLWRTVDRHNVTSIFGRTAAARVSDPAAPAARTYAWLLEARFDAKGEALRVDYLAENAENVADVIYERARTQTANKYPGRVRFGNAEPFAPPPFGIGPLPDDGWQVETVFDYGQYDPSPSNGEPYQPVGQWLARADPFSSYSAGFELRTHRLCRHVLLFHRFAELSPEPVLTQLVRLNYDENPRASRLVRMDSVGYAYDAAQPPERRYRTAPLPPLECGYVPFDPEAHSFQPVTDAVTGTLPGFDKPPYTLVDLYGDGVPGILYADGVSTWYRAPEPPGGSPARFAPPMPLDEFPVERMVEGATLQLIDLDGNSRLELLVSQPGRTGYYQNLVGGGWSQYLPLEGCPSDFLAPGQSLADLSGTGRADLVRINSREVRYYPSAGEAGFSPAAARLNEYDLPSLGASSAKTLITFADLLGAGSLQLALITNGMVKCWPSVGYGYFAPPVELGNAPDFGEEFDAGRLFLMDLDGSGAADIAYLTGNTLRVWLNRGGNSFSEPIEIVLPVTVTSPSQVSFADLAGTGTRSLVVVSEEPAPRVWSYDFCGGRKPYLLSSLRNNLGAETTVEYGSSAIFYLEDKQAGLDWVTSLPFPVQVVTSVEHRDFISETRTRTTYTYHHGFYDFIEREFRGFGMVERRDAELIEGADCAAAAADAAAVERRAREVPPALTKTWYHNGAWIEADELERQYAREYFQGDPEAYRMPPSSYEWGEGLAPDAAALQQSRAALAGSALRSEIYGLDGGPLQDVPYKVSETNYLVRMLQAPRGSQYGVFFVHEREGLDADYERVADDPNVNHVFTLALDDYGSVTLSCAVAYPRRPGSPGSLGAQEQLHVNCDRARYINEPGEPDYCLGLPCEMWSYELLGVPGPGGEYFTFDEISRLVRETLGQAGASPSARLYHWERYYYYDAGGAEAPLGQAGPQQLLRRDESILISRPDIEQLFEGVLTPAELSERLSVNGRFVFDAATGYWWQPSLIATYGDRTNFYLQTGVVDPFGVTATYRYDPHHVYIAETTQAAEGLLEQRVRVEVFDYLKLQPLKVVDVNDNVSEARLDPLGKVFLTSHYGHEGEAAVGFDQILGVAWPEPASAAALVADPQKFIGGAESFTYYDLLSWTGRVGASAFEGLGVDTQALWRALSAGGYVTPEGAILEAFRRLKGPGELHLPAAFQAVSGQVYDIIAAAPHGVPANWVLIAAQNYPAAAPAPPQIHIDYTDGYGRRLQSKIKAEGGPALMADASGRLMRAPGGGPAEGSAAERWVTTGRVRYNNKGLPFKQYEPYLTNSFRYTDDRELEQVAVATTLTYDPLDRPERIDLPVGLFSRFERTAWVERDFDPCDTVRESSYYREHIKDGKPVGLDEFAGQALLKSALSAGTPKTQVFDSLGRVVAVTVENNPTVDADSFVPLGLTREQAEALAAYLRDAAFLDFRGALTIRFQPAEPGFSLNLPPEFQPFEAQIMALLEGLQGRGVEETSLFAYDVQGQEVWAVDPRLRATWPAGRTGAKNFERVFALNGTALKTVSADAGTRYELPDIKGNTFFEQDGNGTTVARSFDPLGRALSVRVSRAVGTALTEWTAQRLVYGDALENGEPVAPDPRRDNLMGAPYRVFDQSGLRQYDLYALTGGMMTVKRQLARNYRTPVDWPAGPLNPSSPLLEPAVYETRTRYDALARVAEQIDAAQYAHRQTYLLSGGVGSGSLVAPGGAEHHCVRSITYNARSQPLEITYGNGAVATYRYDPLTSRLTGLTTVGPDGTEVLQSLTAYHDAVGNLTHLTDKAFAGLFGPQNAASPGADYDYDALYRLVGAQGQEHAGRGFERDRQGGYEGLEITYRSGGIDPDALVPYRRFFAYDSGGNLYAVLHQSPGTDWAGEMVVSDGSNRAVEAAIFSPASGVPAPPAERVAPAAEIDRFFDGNGNQVRMLGIDRLEWSYLNQVARVTLSPEAAPPVEEQYVYDDIGSRVRKVTATPEGSAETVYLGLLEIERAAAATGEPAELRRRIRANVASFLIAELMLEAESRGAAPRLIYNLIDPLRSVTFQLGDDGRILTYEDYVPYGGTSFAVVADPEALALKEARYSQQERDRSTGLYYYGARYLTPWSGRWSSPDPAGPVDGLNLYSFVGSNPSSAIDLGGAIKITLDDGTVIDVEPDSILASVHSASTKLQTELSSYPLASTGTARKMPLFEPKEQGDLFTLAFQQRGDPLAKKPVTSFALKYGNLESTLQKGKEMGAHLVSTIKNKDYTGGEKPDYAALSPTTNPKAEARRMLHMMKVKATPTGSFFNNTMIPVMTISETDRSRIGGMLAMIELYNIKYGARTFDEAFDNGNDPSFVGAKTKGGAKALKTIDRAYRGLKIAKGQMMTRLQTRRLHNSLETFVKQLHTGRGGAKPSKFSGLKTKDAVLDKVVETLVKRAGITEAQRQKRQAKFNAKRGIGGTT